MVDHAQQIARAPARLFRANNRAQKPLVRWLKKIKKKQLTPAELDFISLRRCQAFSQKIFAKKNRSQKSLSHPQSLILSASAGLSHPHSLILSASAGVKHFLKIYFQKNKNNSCRIFESL